MFFYNYTRGWGEVKKNLPKEKCLENLFIKLVIKVYYKTNLVGISTLPFIINNINYQVLWILNNTFKKSRAPWIFSFCAAMPQHLLNYYLVSWPTKRSSFLCNSRAREKGNISSVTYCGYGWAQWSWELCLKFDLETWLTIFSLECQASFKSNRDRRQMNLLLEWT